MHTGECIVAKPPILFLDEPTTGLDSAAAYQLIRQLKKIAKATGNICTCIYTYRYEYIYIHAHTHTHMYIYV